jgi:hypothetical protein
MQRKTWLLIVFCFLAFLELASWPAFQAGSPCLVGPPNQSETANNNRPKECPTFHAGIGAFFSQTDEFLERHDKSIIGAFTVVLAISTIGLWMATNRLWRAGEKQFAFLTASSVEQSQATERSIAAAETANELNQKNSATSRRPWVSIGNPEFVGPLIFRPIGASSTLTVKVRNVGQSPATNFGLLVRAMVLPAGGVLFSEFHEKFIDQTRRHGSIYSGQVVFPGEVGEPLSQDFSMLKRDIDAGILVRDSGPNALAVMLGIGAYYRASAASDSFLTCRFYLLPLVLGSDLPAQVMNGLVSQSTWDYAD